MAAAPPSLRVGDRVAIVDVTKEARRCGVLKFIGKTRFSAGTWCGVYLDSPLGKNDGTVDGVKYFACAANHGVFVPVSKVKLEEDSSSAAKAAPLPRSRIARPSFGGKRVVHEVKEVTPSPRRLTNRSVTPPTRQQQHQQKTFTMQQQQRQQQRQQQQQGTFTLHRTVEVEPLSSVARARAAASQSQRRKQSLKKKQGTGKAVGSRSGSEVSSRQSTPKTDAARSSQSTRESAERINDTFTVEDQAPVQPKTSEVQRTVSLDVEGDDGDVLIADISQCSMIPVAFSTPFFGSTNDSSGQSAAPLLTPESEAVMQVEANRVGMELAQAVLGVELVNVARQGTEVGESGVQLAGADAHLEVIGRLCERLDHSCHVFDVLAVVVSHLAFKLERSQKNTWKAWDHCAELQYGVNELLKTQQEMSVRIAALESEKAHLQQQYETVCSTAEDDKVQYTQQLRDMKSSNDVLCTEMDTLKTEYETMKRNLEEANENLSSELEAANKEHHQQMSELECELEMLKENIESIAEDKAKDITERYKSYADEVESLKAVMDMKNTELKKMRHQSLSLQEQADNMVDFERKTRTLQLEKEQLRENLEQQRHVTRRLHTEVDTLQLSLHKEVETRKRIEQTFEEALWRAQHDEVPVNDGSPRLSVNWSDTLDFISPQKSTHSYQTMELCSDSHSASVEGSDLSVPH